MREEKREAAGREMGRTPQYLCVRKRMRKEREERFEDEQRAVVTAF